MTIHGHPEILRLIYCYLLCTIESTYKDLWPLISRLALSHIPQAGIWLIEKSSIKCYELDIRLELLVAILPPKSH